MRKEAVDVAKKRSGDGEADKPTTLSTGVRAILRPVTVSLIDEVTARIEDPPIPMWHNPDKDREEENPADPAYHRALEEAARLRGLAAIDAMILFGVELVDGLPDDGAWLKNLRYLERLGHIDLSGFDLSDDLDQEFLYKRYAAVGKHDLERLSEKSGQDREDVDRAVATFRGDDSRATD